MRKEIAIGDVKIGQNHPIAIQSMTNTDTTDVISTIAQIKSLERLGCEIVRVAVYDEKSAQSIKDIKAGINIPLVADIHFDYRLAIASMENGIDKVRINPGNIGSQERVKALVDCAKMHKIPIRIGVNSGSLPKDLLYLHGNSVKAMIESARSHITLLEKFGFDDIVVSLKSSNVNMTIQSCQAFDKEFQYPQHIGVTEAGGDRAGYIRSAIGIGSLLREGIGDTIRVTLSNDPCEEILAAWDILSAIDIRKRGLEIISCPTCARHSIDVFEISRIIKEHYKYDKRYLRVAIMGCVVNGPGESSNAHIGIAGGKDYSLIFKNGEKYKKIENINIVNELIKEIDIMFAQQ